MIARSQTSIRKDVYRRILELGTVSKAELMQEFTLTSSSMTRLLDDLNAQEIIRVSGLGSSTGGRKPILFQTNPTYRYLLGLEISRIYSTLGLYDMQLNMLASVRWKMDPGMTPERLVDRVGQEVETFLNEHGLQRDKLLGIGVGAVGPLDRERGLIQKPEFFPASGWDEVPICELLERRLGVTARLDNGSNAALLGEHWALRGRSARHLLYIHAGIGLRAAMMSEGRLIRGAADAEGAVGQMIIATDGPRFEGRGNHGAWEAFVSVRTLEHRVRTQIKIGRPSMLGGRHPDDIRFADLIEALEADDALVKEQFTEAAAYLGIGIANLINVMHPDIVVLGGPLIEAHPLVYETAVATALKNTASGREYSPAFSLAELKENAVAAGAALMLLQEWEV
ncbi:ROK family protein [Saccharibacillus kuerlensis]|uniref:Transcriptional regulator n=1 Tax=Saccharibacillus kuerlensis TaxID=459527 RepID=A0ABQ2KYX5_9BACL|nr:ROK family protein [Saccharibacillus kuerlensis]GGN96988.1 transcriptional regulator [Saccharibacillus kuerlensis]